jgi:hypothetical protein
MKTLVQQSENFGGVSSDLDDSKRLVDELKGDEEIDEKLGEHLVALWEDGGIQNTYDNRAQFQLTDSTDYFMKRLSEVCCALRFIRSRLLTASVSSRRS